MGQLGDPKWGLGITMGPGDHKGALDHKRATMRPGDHNGVSITRENSNHKGACRPRDLKEA